MTGDRWDQIEQLLEEALARSPGERAAFLREACDDAALREEVTALAAAYEEADGLFDDVASAVAGLAFGALQEGEGRDAAEQQAGDQQAKADPLALEGTQVRRYAIEAHLGGGGMGVVYRARDTKLGRRVALKFLPPHLSASSEAKARFMREARAASALDHSNIGTIHEIEKTEAAVGAVSAGQRYIAMTYYDGETLKAKIARGPLPIDEAISYAIQIAEGLAKAHEAGIIHRDVKPANVIVTEDGLAKIVDFGLARVADLSELTHTGQALGTAAYMSPEQARGEAVDARTDLWSLGVVLYEMLTGARPFRGRRPEAVIYSILHEPPEPPAELRAEVPAALATVVQRCLKKDPELRYASSEAVLDDLRGFRHGYSPPQGRVNERESRASGPAATVGRRRTTVILSALLIVVAGLLAYPYLWDVEPEHGATSIAVLPFTYLAATDAADYFSLGMTDELLSRLAQIEGLSVIARTSVMKYQGTDKTIPEIGRELGVRHLVEGSVQLAGEQVRIQAQLIDARTGAQLWAEGFTRPFRNVLGLQSEVARQIADELQLELLPETRRQLAKAPEVDSAAYALYLQGRHLRFQQTGQGLTRAVRLLRRSVQIDSTFAPAWATLSASAWLAPLFGAILPRGLSVDSLARAAARQAVALDSTSAEAHIAMGNIHQTLNFDFPAAGSWLRRAVELNPGLANAHREYGFYLSRMGQFEEAGSFLRKAARLDPASPVTWQALGWNELYRGRYREARRHFEQALTLQPDNWWIARMGLGEVYLAQGQMGAALWEMRRTVEVNPSPYSLAELGRAYARAGRQDSARALWERMREEFGHAPIEEAVIYAALEETDQALDLLEEVGGTNTLKVGQWWELLRGEPRYDRLLKRMGLDDASVRATMERLKAMDGPGE